MDDRGEAEVARPSSNDSIRSLKFSEKEREWGLKWFVIISAGLTRASQLVMNGPLLADLPSLLYSQLIRQHFGESDDFLHSNYNLHHLAEGKPSSLFLLN